MPILCLLTPALLAQRALARPLSHACSMRASGNQRAMHGLLARLATRAGHYASHVVVHHLRYLIDLLRDASEAANNNPVWDVSSIHSHYSIPLARLFCAAKTSDLSLLSKQGVQPATSQLRCRLASGGRQRYQGGGCAACLAASQTR